MFLDALLLVSDAQALAATGFSTNTIDLGGTNRKVGTGEPMGFGVSVDVAAAAGGTFVFEVVESANADLSSPVVIESRTILAANLTAGSLHFMPVAAGYPRLRYLGLRYTLGGTTPTITVTAWLTSASLFSVAMTNYAKGYSI